MIKDAFDARRTKKLFTTDNPEGMVGLLIKMMPHEIPKG